MLPGRLLPFFFTRGNYLVLSESDHNGKLTLLRGFAKKEKFQKSEISREVGGWVQVSLGIFFGENRPKIALNQW